MNRSAPALALADDLSIFHDEAAAHQSMNGHAGDLHAFERRNLATRLEVSRRDRILAIKIDERNVGIRAGQQGAFGRIEAERLRRLGRRQPHVIAE